MKNLKSILRSREEIREVIDLWELSGKSKKEFALEMGINYQTFIGWAKRHEQKRIIPKEKFIPITVNPGPMIFAELQLKNGEKIIFYQAIPADYFQKILK